MKQCAKCGSMTVIDNARVMDRGHGNGDAGALSLVLYDDPKAWFFPGAHTFALNAHVCCACGFTEFYVADPAGLLAASRKVPQQS